MGAVTLVSRASKQERLALWGIYQAPAFCGEQIERHERRRRLRRELHHARLCGVEAQLQRIEIQSLRTGDNDLAVDHAAGRKLSQKGLVQFGKIAVKRTQIAALDEHARATAKDNGSKAVPFRFEQEVT